MSPTLQRPFHFGVVLWGERFRNYFLDYCLPSLLAPGNLAALRTEAPSKFVIATFAEDWSAMQSTAIFRALARHVEPVYLQLPPAASSHGRYQSMSVGHKLVCIESFREKAYAVFVPPDGMFADGMVVRLQELALAGKTLVLAAALRFGEEPFLDRLRDKGLLPNERPSESGRPLTIKTRDLADAAVKGFHPETLSYEWQSSYFCRTPAVAAWWRVPNEDGIVLHCMSWAPLMIDYAALPALDMSTLDQWTIDGDFLHRNFARSSAVHVVRDSDEMFLASFTPIAENWGPLRPTRAFRNNLIREIVFAAQVRRTYHGPFVDPLKRQLFLEPARWHCRPLTPAWDAVERMAARLLSRYVVDDSDDAPARRVAVRMLARVLAVVDPLLFIWFYPRSVTRRLGQIMKGDRAALRLVWWHARRSLRQAVGRPLDKKKAAEPPGR